MSIVDQKGDSFQTKIEKYEQKHVVEILQEL